MSDVPFSGTLFLDSLVLRQKYSLASLAQMVRLTHRASSSVPDIKLIQFMSQNV
jgi:hypothetical protein